MDEIEDDDDGEEYEDEQIHQMIYENGIRLQSLTTLLIQKGILKEEEIEAEMERLHDELESSDEQS